MTAAGACDICGREAAFTCEDRKIDLCMRCVLLGGRLGAVEHPMPGGATICVHRRRDSLAVKFGAGNSVLYQAARD